MHQYFTRVFSVSTYFESGRDTMKENTIALKFYNIAIDASLIDRWNKKNIVSSTEDRILYLSHVFIPSINNDNRNVILVFVVCFIFSNMKMYQDFFLSLLLLSNRKFSNRGKCFHFAQLSSNNYQREQVDGFELLKSIELLKKIYPKFLLSVYTCV